MLEQFPQALKESRRWVCFDAAKTPINPATGQNAKPNDPATWGTLEAAQAAVSRFGLRGVGVLLGDGLCGIDIDHCRDPDTGVLSDMAREIIDGMQTYAEESPSGTGVHLLFTGQKPAGACRKSSIGLEMYDGGRYFTVTGGAAQLAEYLQVMVGYCLCGSTREQCMFFLYGDGANGKSTFLETLAKMLGDYCMNAQADTIASTRSRSSGAARSDVARLKGARFVTLEEGDQGATLDEGLVKQMTGGNTITARFQYGKEFEFRPEFKLVEATNHLPKIHGTDVGIWRRIRLVPFTQSIPEEKQDILLPQKLEAELPGILNWALDGLQKWLANSQGGRRHGLPACAAVDSAVSAYKQDQDRIAAFLADCTEPAEGSTVQASVLFRTYLNWCSENNEKWRMANKQFGMEVKKHYEIRKGMYYNEYVDMALSDEGMRCMALGRGTDPSVAPARSRPLYEQTRLKN